jgi:hypothetical protein
MTVMAVGCGLLSERLSVSRVRGDIDPGGIGAARSLVRVLTTVVSLFGSWSGVMIDIQTRVDAAMERAITSRFMLSALRANGCIELGDALPDDPLQSVVSWRDRRWDDLERVVPSRNEQRVFSLYDDSCFGRLADYFAGELSAMFAYEVTSLIEDLVIGSGSDRVAVPRVGAMYGGHSMEFADDGRWTRSLGDSRGSSLIEADWPDGSGLRECDVNSVKGLNYAGDWWSAGGWGENCLKIMRRGAVYTHSVDRQAGCLPIHILSPDMYREFDAALNPQERACMSEYAMGLGFPGVVAYEGCPVLLSYPCKLPSCCVNLAGVKLVSQYRSLVSVSSVPDQEALFSARFCGNYVFNPRCVVGYISPNDQ